MYRIPNARIGVLCRVRKGLDERIDESVLRWFRHVERDRIAKRVCVGECAGSRSVGRPQKRWSDTVKEFLKKRGLDVSEQGEWSRIGVKAGSVALGINP